VNKNYKDIARRAGKTFIQAALAVFLVGTVSLPSILVVGLISALFSVGMNLFNVTPESWYGRAGSTFLQTFLAAWAVSGYELTIGVLTAAAAASISALYNFAKETQY
jgi:hypothetical protein